MDKNLRDLQRKAEQGDLDAIERLFTERQRSGQPIPQAQIDLLARLGQPAAIQIMTDAGARVQTNFTQVLFRELGQTPTIQVVGTVLRKSLGKIFGSHPQWFKEIKVTEQAGKKLEIALWDLVQLFQSWNATSKLTPKQKHILHDAYIEVVTTSNLSEDTKGLLVNFDPYDYLDEMSTALGLQIPSLIRHLFIICAVIVDTEGHGNSITSLVRKGSTESFTDMAVNLTKHCLKIWGADHRQAIRALGAVVLQDFINLFVIGVTEKIAPLLITSESVIQSPSFYRNEIKAKRFTVVDATFLDEQARAWAEAINDGPFLSYHGEPRDMEVTFIVWTEHEDEAVQRATALLTNLNLGTVSVVVNRSAHDRGHAKRIFSQNLHETAMAQPGWTVVFSDREIQARTKIYLHNLENFCGGAERISGELSDDSFQKDLSPTEKKIAQNNMRAVYQELIALGLVDLGRVELQNTQQAGEGFTGPFIVRSLAVNVKNCFAIRVHLSGNNYQIRRRLHDVATRNGGEYIGFSDPERLLHREQQRRDGLF